MCLMCGLAQSMPLLGLGYMPTDADIIQLEQLSQAVMITAQVNRKQLVIWDEKIDELAAHPWLQDKKRELYMLLALDDMIAQAQILY